MPGAAASESSSCDLQVQLSDLQLLLEKLPGAGSDLAAAASAKDLKLLRTAASQFASLHVDDALAVCLGLPVLTAVVSCVECLVHQLLKPRADLYSSYGGAPCEPPAELRIPEMTYQDLLATKLHLLLLLLKQLGSVQYFVPSEQQTAVPAAAKDDGRERNRPKYVVGIVEIVEEPETAASEEQQLQARLQQLVKQVILACALYASCSCKSGAYSAASECSNSREHKDTVKGPQSDCCDLEAHCSAVFHKGWELLTPWSSQQCQQQTQQLLQHIAGHVVVVTESTENGSSRKGQESAQGSKRLHQQKPQEQTEQQQWHQHGQQLLSVLLPQIIDSLRDTLLAQHRHRKIQDKGDLVPYKGPDTYKRCLAARQLAWVVQELQTPQLTEDTCGLLLPVVLATSEDPAPAVQQYGHAMLSWLAAHCEAGSLRWQRMLLLDEAKRLVVGCEESCWRTAMPAAANLVMAVERKHDVRSTGYHTLVQELITEAERNAHSAQKRLVFLACLAKLLPCLGLYIVRYFAQLMPLLLEWTHAYDEGTVLVALQVLGEVIRHAWPRMAIHAVVLWEHVVEVVKSADERAWMKDFKSVKGQQCHKQQKLQSDSNVVQAAVEVAKLLHVCGGEGFQSAVKSTAAEASGESGGSPSLCRLLQACNC